MDDVPRLWDNCGDEVRETCGVGEDATGNETW